MDEKFWLLIFVKKVKSRMNWVITIEISFKTKVMVFKKF